MAQKFKKGDVVKLKSGSPIMTVDGYAEISDLKSPSRESEDIVACVWFDSKNNIQDANFHQDLLEKGNS